jgi:hypothetical protein
VIALAVRWYARFRLSYADVAEWPAERGFTVDRSSVYRWVQRFLPLFGTAARRYRRRVGQRWRVDETYCAFQGRHASIYRAIDQDGQVVDAYRRCWPTQRQRNQQGWTTEGEVEELIAEVQAWGERPDAFHAIFGCAVVGWVGDAA